MTTLRSDPLELLAPLLPDDALATVTLGGLGERPLAAPTQAEEWTAVVRRAGEEDWRLLIQGSGSSTIQVPERVDLVLSTRNVHGVTSYEPGDGTLSARAGSTMAELASAVAAGGHHLSPDVPRPSRATLGGVLAGGRSGIDRLRYGPVRHNVLGMLACLADGTIARTGGQLVKNVTGYDLHRLYCGSQGTLCVILEASLRLYPLPEEQALVRAVFPDRDAAVDSARGLTGLRFDPEAVCLDGFLGNDVPPEWTLSVFLSGRSEVVAYDVEALRNRLGEVEIERGSAAANAKQTLRDERSEHCVEWTARPSRLTEAIESAGADCVAFDDRAWLLVQPLVASLRASFSSPGADSTEALRRRLRYAPERPPQQALSLMWRLKKALDPAGLFPAPDLG